MVEWSKAMRCGVATAAAIVALASCANEPETVLSSAEATVEGEGLTDDAGGLAFEDVQTTTTAPDNLDPPVEDSFTTTSGPPESDDVDFDNGTTTTSGPPPEDQQDTAPTTTEASQSTPTTTLLPRDITTTTYSAGPNGQPGFATTADADVSGAWVSVGIWSNGEFLDDGFQRELIISGRRIEGHDSCNFHSHGVIYPTPDGKVEVVPARFTNENECTSDALDAFRSGAFDATRWGFTSSGNLVLANDTDLVEFTLAQERTPTQAPVGTLQLDSLWFGENGLDHDGWEIDNQSGVELTFTSDSAVLTQTCLLYTSPSPRDRG